MPENFKVKIDMPGHEGEQRRPFKRRTQLDEVVLWIEAQDYDEFTKSELIKMLKKYPYTLYEHFRQNISVHLARVNAKKRTLQTPAEIKEKNETEERIEESNGISQEGADDFDQVG